MNIKIKMGKMIFVESSPSQLREAIKNGDFQSDNMLKNCAFKIELAQKPKSIYTLEQIDIIELQEKVETLKTRIEELEQQTKGDNK